MGDKQKPKETPESEAVSRRSFMRKSAEVAAISLFGVLGLDAVADKVLERIAENQAMGRLADSAAGTLKRERLDHYASAENLLPKLYCDHDHPGCLNGYYCTEPHDCPSSVGCASDVGCSDFTPQCTPGPYGCTGRQLTCSNSITCPVEISCTAANLNCPPGYKCVTVQLDCNDFYDS